jgi:hypothetical protein
MQQRQLHRPRLNDLLPQNFRNFWLAWLFSRHWARILAQGYAARL